jgi:hypothetical protein
MAAIARPVGNRRWNLGPTVPPLQPLLTHYCRLRSPALGQADGRQVASLSQWRCRLCGFDRCHRVAVRRKNGARYETRFSACSQCSVMILNPAQFDANSATAPNVEAAAMWLRQ